MSKLKEYTTPRVNLNVSYRLCMFTVCQRRFIDCNKGNTVVWDVGSVGDYACVVPERVCELFVLPPKFCCDPKTSVRCRVY